MWEMNCGIPPDIRVINSSWTIPCVSQSRAYKIIDDSSAYLEMSFVNYLFRNDLAQLFSCLLEPRTSKIGSLGFRTKWLGNPHFYGYFFTSLVNLGSFALAMLLFSSLLGAEVLKSFRRNADFPSNCRRNHLTNTNILVSEILAQAAILALVFLCVIQKYSIYFSLNDISA